jgi:hypothetical protein
MTDTAPKSNPSPDEALAATITDAINAANLVSTQKLPRIQDGLAKGTLTASDWKLLAELALPSDKGGDLS